MAREYKELQTKAAQALSEVVSESSKVYKSVVEPQKTPVLQGAIKANAIRSSPRLLPSSSSARRMEKPLVVPVPEFSTETVTHFPEFADVLDILSGSYKSRNKLREPQRLSVNSFGG
jgi:hypothetical protein